MRIVVDAMGSDTYPSADVAGAVMAANESDLEIILVGDDATIRQHLSKSPISSSLNSKISIVHASDIVTMEDKPAVVGKAKPDSSLHVGMNLLKNDEADAFVTAGNTGAAHAIAMLYTLKRIPGVKRPALSAIFPIHNRPIIFLDIGANTDSRPEWLAQFAIMGKVYSTNALGLSNPRIGLLSNGEEDSKGDQLTLESHKMLSQIDINFVGNVEPSQILEDQVDVVVSDGFVGNILLKTFEASTRYLGSLIRQELRSSLISSIGGLLIRPAMQRVRQNIDTFEIGGAPLLGVNGVVMIAHGSSDDRAIKNAIFQASKAVKGNVILTIQEGIQEMPTFQIVE